jgi:quercetin dioxygenase-like cupin family protein
MMDELFLAAFENKCEPRVFLDGSRRWVVSLPSLIVGKGSYEPGWRWSVHAGPQRGEPSAKHIGYVESGSLVVRTSAGQEQLVSAGEAFEVGPGHDAWVVGDQPCVALDFVVPR